MIRPYPIGVDFDDHVQAAASYEVDDHMHRWSKELRLDSKLLGIGIDRLDYTKGIPERLRFFDRVFELHPEYRGKLVFIQVAVPSRSSLPAYRQLDAEVDAVTAQINLRWARGSWKPIVLLKKHIGEREMIALHRLAHFCLVTPLHDGMNLVSKEFVASRIDEDGVLILSRFAGAARELKDALLINPFSIDEGVSAIDAALTMPADERRRRMMKMRETVEHNNVYRWAGKFLSDLARIEFPDLEGSAELDRGARAWSATALEVAV
jgi:trehalose 6-phosphate synthase